MPDVSVDKIGDDFFVTLNGDQVPHLRISKTYKELMTQGSNGSDVRDYIREKIRSGKFLIKSIHQRQQTILNIANEIVKRQREFLESGTAFAPNDCPTELLFDRISVLSHSRSIERRYGTVLSQGSDTSVVVEQMFEIRDRNR